jgi:cellulose synthase/poly-beta-1,6-N-acetylglucosamine synthase-like glycosyltransferase
MEVVFIDDASTDKTLAIVEKFVKENPDLQVKIVCRTERRGKANGLNAALPVCSNDLVLVSDADTLWPTDILVKTLPYLSDPTIGALSGMGRAKNPEQSWVTRAEKGYMSMMSVWRLGESKIHSTIRFEGAFTAFKRKSFLEFDDESGADDSGTALRVIQKGYRAIVVPEAVITAEIAFEMRKRIRAKTRRAVHLAGLWVQCLRLLIKNRLKLPKRIAIPEIFLSLFMPFIFVALVCLTFVMLAYYTIPILFFFALLGIALVVPGLRSHLAQAIVDQFILFYAVLLYSVNRRFIIWEHTR